ncbi:MAG: filamentous hemagglutinin family protein, partial [Alphaproteobacteria bacterium]|nr:filamentous hemagglutinin family protein [Alphaproteobacteria bacterium]
SVAGNVVVNGYIDPSTGQVLGYNPLPFYAFGSRLGDLPAGSASAGAGANAFPVTFQAAALRGDLTVAGSIQLAPSNQGQLDLLAYGSLDARASLTGNGTQAGANGLPSGTSSFSDVIGAQAIISTGPSLLSNAFDPYMPWWNATPSAGSSTFSYPTNTAVVLLHQDDPTPDHFYALTGDIVDGAGTSSLAIEALAFEITKPARVAAGRDIVDLNFFGENLNAKDLTSVVAGRDLFYAGKDNTAPNEAQVGSAGDQSIATLRIAGPGFLDVEAGRDLGPFLPASTLGEGQGIVAIGNAAEISSGYNPADGGVIGNRILAFENPGANNTFVIDPTLAGFAPQSNTLLPRQSANISVLFGMAPNGNINAANYQGFIEAYIDPANNPGDSNKRDYSQQLEDFLTSLGANFVAQPGSPAITAANAFTTFKALPVGLQDEFARQVFFAELKLAGDPKGCCFNQTAIGFAAITTLFPAASGFPATGSSEAVTSTELNLLHSTVQTQLGGNISILGPTGSVILGTLSSPTAVGKNAADESANLPVPLSNEGLLTLAGGAISTFTDGSVEVNQSRIFTEQGGDLVMWSSNGDLDAGRGSKTSASFPPLTVSFPLDDQEIVDLAGLVTGAGIAVLQSTPDAPASNAFLIAPRGAVNAGDAGIRVSGNLAIAAARVENASNIDVGGTKVGVPTVVSVNLGSAEAASAAAT